MFRDGLAVLTPSGQLWWVAAGTGAGSSGRAGLSGGWCSAGLSRAAHKAADPWRVCIVCMSKHTPPCWHTLPASRPPCCRCVPDLHEPRLQRFPDPAPGLAAAGGGSGVHCMTVLPPAVSASGALEVHAAVLLC